MHQFFKAIPTAADDPDAPGSDHRDGGQCEAESNAKGGDQAEAHPELMKAKATDENNDRGRAGGKTAAEAKEDYLRSGNILAGKRGGDFARMSAGMRVFEHGRLLSRGMTLVVRMVVRMVVVMRMIVRMPVGVFMRLVV